jgi:lipopolysaccharide/colanic/teichoic acid biosynthesis glycosyltransferase
VRNLLYRFIKRLFDILSSALAITVSSPLWLIIAIGIKASSKGSVFYRADRVGKGAKKFTLYKFRSMHLYASEDKGQGEQREGGAIANVARVFPFGAFLRKSKLDELPQLLNILMGQMSVVGPRPTSELGAKNHFIGKYDNVLTVRPGLAGLDSLYDYAHGELVVQDSDEYYNKIAPVRDRLASMHVEKQSVWLDIYCILRTLKLMFQITVQKKREFPLTKYEAEAEKSVFGVATMECEVE